MATYKARQISPLALLLPAVFLLMALGFIISGVAVMLGVVVLAFVAVAAYFFFRARRIRSYTVTDDAILVDGTDKKIPLGEVVGIMATRNENIGSVMSQYMHEGQRYLPNMGLASVKRFGGISMFTPQTVNVYTTNTDNLQHYRNCYLLTPADKEGLVREVIERMKKSRK